VVKKLIDFEVALNRLGNDEEFLLEMLDELMTQFDESIPDLHNAITNSDFANVRMLAHGMKGASSSLGADRIADYFQLLEKKGSDQNLDGADELMERIKLTFDEMKGEIEKY